MAIEIAAAPAEPARPYMPTKAGTEDWCTPRALVDVIRRIFEGRIDLDPASNPWSVVDAEREVWLPRWAEGRVIPPRVEVDDGLKVEWRGNVYVNPPYSAELLGRFMARAVDAAHYGANVIMLAPAKTSLVAWQAHVPKAPAICFVGGRVTYLVPDKEPMSATFSSALVLWTRDRELVHRFAWYLDTKHGHVVFTK
jgi:hypothetical protein